MNEATKYSYQELLDLLAKKDEKIARLTKSVFNLEHKVKLLTNKLYGRSSEVRPSEDEDLGDQQILPFALSNELDEDEKDGEGEGDNKANTKSAKKRKKPSLNRLSFPSDAPVEEIFLDVPDDEKINPETGETYPVKELETTERLVYIPGSYKVLRYIRPIYDCGKLGTHKMDLPEQVIPGCTADVTLLVDILLRRFCDHTPFYRMVEAYCRDGFQVSRQTLDLWYLNISKALLPLGEQLKKEILAGRAVHMDETTVTLLEKAAKGSKTAYMWLLCGWGKEGPQYNEDGGLAEPPLVYFHFADNRRHENATEILGDYQGVLHSDCYEAYEKLAKTETNKMGLDWSPCWSHLRRYFFEATECKLRTKALDLIDEIFANEREFNGLNETQLLIMRKHKQIPLADEFDKLIEGNRYHRSVLTSDSMNKAVNYYLCRKKHFRAFLTNAKMCIHNNAAERAIRPFTIGRKNWMFVGSKDGGHASAILTSLIQTCRRLKINPREYLTDVLRRLPYASEGPPEKLRELLPHLWKANPHPKNPHLPGEYPLT